MQHKIFCQIASAYHHSADIQMYQPNSADRGADHPKVYHQAQAVLALQNIGSVFALLLCCMLVSAEAECS